MRKGNDIEETIEMPEFFSPEIEKLRMILLAVGILYTYGFPTILGGIGRMICSLSIPAFYIVSGYLVLEERPDTGERILRAIKRSALCFAILFVIYLGLSLLVDWEGSLLLLNGRSFWIDFLLLNIWSLPIGSTIWYVQALLYAYLILYVLYKLKLMRLDIVFAALCLAVALLSGELSSLVGFQLLGHTYLGGNFVTRALPYLLIGCFICRKEDFFAELNIKHYIMIGAVGVALSLAEYVWLIKSGNAAYSGHMFGMGLAAISVCLFVFFVSEMELASDELKNLTRFELMIPYFICSPIYYLLIRFFQYNINDSIYRFIGFTGVLTALFSFLLLYVYAIIRRIIAVRRYAALDEEIEVTADDFLEPPEEED